MLNLFVPYYVKHIIVRLDKDDTELSYTIGGRGIVFLPALDQADVRPSRYVIVCNPYYYVHCVQVISRKGIFCGMS